jgi:hypothetical protein
MNNIDTTNYRLNTQGDTASVVILDGGEWIEFTSQLPTAKAVDAVRCLLNSQHFGDIRWTFLTKDDNAAVAAALGVTETLDGHAVETVDAGELRDGDQVVFTSGSRTFFTRVTGDAFRTYSERTPGSGIVYGDWFLLIGGTRRYVAPGTTFKRATDPAAVVSQKDQARRDLQASLRSIR